MSLFKTTPLRSKAIRNAARGEQCQLQIPGVCNGDPATVVACHSPLAEDRQGTKAPDHAVAFGCSDCHDHLDKRAGRISAEDQHYYFHRGMVQTIARLIEMGIITVKK